MADRPADTPLRVQSEKDLLTDVLLPIFAARHGGRAIFWHGPKERGKDIVYLTDKGALGVVVAKHAKQYNDSAKAQGYVGHLVEQVKEAMEADERVPARAGKAGELTIALWGGATLEALKRLKRNVGEIRPNKNGLRVEFWDSADRIRKEFHKFGTSSIAGDVPDRLAQLRRSVEALRENDPTLEDFPGKFDPLAIVVGDRRLNPPDLWQDAVARAASPGDLALIHLLRLDSLKSVEVWPDTAILEDHDRHGDRAALRNCHILSIGCPAVNLISRQLNTAAAFRFRIDPAIERAMEEATRTLQGLAEDRRVSHTEWVDQIGGTDHLNSLIQGYKGRNLVDLLSGMEHPTTDQRHIAWGVVSLTRSPYSPDHFAILAAGYGINGTFGALRALAGDVDVAWVGLDWRKWHPVGGVFNHRRPDYFTSAFDPRCRCTEQSPPYRLACFSAVFRKKGREPYGGRTVAGRRLP
ncbi:MAG: hypothetical protein FJ291_26090 [Planctomycetes bacterium]|nr:hypothetical protein [Planctomycetota bacterium]